VERRPATRQLSCGWAGEGLAPGGKIVTRDGTEEAHTDNADAFVLDVERRLWRRER
jgi:hypothetical protein